MNRNTTAFSFSTLALWGLLGAMPHLAWGIGGAPAIRGNARLGAVTATLNNTEALCPNVGGVPGGAGCTNFNTTDSSRDIMLGDVNADGQADVLIANTGVEMVCLNNAGSFSSCSTFNAADNSYGLTLGDVDGDGDLDVVIANFDPGVNDRVCFNNGSGGFGSCADFNTNDNTRGIALGDIDGDGDLDAVLVSAATFNDRICENDGSGIFSLGTQCVTFNDTLDSRAVVLGDLNGDGDLDAVIANSNLGFDRFCTNDGSGGFTACADFNTSNDTSFGLTLGDVDNDGDLDAVIANTGGAGASDRICPNVAGVLATGTSCTNFNTTDSTRDVALGDVDNDGDLDIALANAVGAERICTNNLGSFSSCNTFNSADDSLGIALGRLDNDGLSDVTTKFVGGVTTSNFALTLASMITGTKPAGLMALYEFDTKYCNKDADETLSNLRTRTIRISKGNVLNFAGLAPNQYLTAPEWREGGIGAELVVPTAGQTFGYADGSLAPDTGTPECATIHYRFNLFSLDKYKFAVRLYGVAAGPDALPDPLAGTDGSANDLTAMAAPEIELDLGALQAAPEPENPPSTTPGGSAPTPATPNPLAFPAGVSNLPSRR